MKDIPNNKVYIPKWQITYIKDHLNSIRERVRLTRSHLTELEGSIEYLEKHVVKVAESFFEEED